MSAFYYIYPPLLKIKYNKEEFFEKTDGIFTKNH